MAMGLLGLLPPCLRGQGALPIMPSGIAHLPRASKAHLSQVELRILEIKIPYELRSLPDDTGPVLETRPFQGWVHDSNRERAREIMKKFKVQYNQYLGQQLGSQ